jgi:hypothetical protein
LRLDVGKNKGKKKEEKKRSQQINDTKEHPPNHNGSDMGQDPVPGRGQSMKNRFVGVHIKRRAVRLNSGGWKPGR